MNFIHSLINSFRFWLRDWLGVEPGLGERIDTAAKANVALDFRLTEIERQLDALNSSTVEGLQAQISALSQQFSLHPPKAKKAPEVEMMTGHVRFSDRKRQFEADHRRSVTNKTGEQIVENNRLIASGTRQTDPS